MDTYSRVYAAIDLDAILHNINEIQKLLDKDTKIMAVIKTDGYGHGAVPIGKELEPMPCIWGYAVATVEEGVILRRNGLKKPILVLGIAFPEQFETMADLGLRPTVASLGMARQMSEAMEKARKTLRIHVKIDTGLSRLGFQVTEKAAEEIAQIHRLRHMIMEGLFTHFIKSDALDKTTTRQQLKGFGRMQEMLKGKGVQPEILHSSNSAGAIDLPEANMGLVRAGISLYGIWPSEEVQKEKLHLKPALSLKSRIVFLKELPKGRTISYGGTYQLKEPATIATIPIGYGDGYPRSLSNCGYVLIRGQKAPVCGRICMDQFMVDVTHIKGVMEGDEVVLVGTSGQERISMEEIGELSGRFHYEFACGLGKRIPRIYYKNGRIAETKDYFGE